MRFAAWCGLALLLAAPRMIWAQQTSTPAAPPQKAQSVEIHEIEIQEPQTPESTDAPAPAAPTIRIPPRSTQDAPAPADAPRPPAGRMAIQYDDNGNKRVIWFDVDDEGRMLGESMDRALEFNPEIRAMRAELQALLARLDQLEQKTAADVVRKRIEIKRLIDQRTKDKDMVEKNSKDPKELADLDAEIAARGMELNYLIGKEPGARSDARDEDHFRVRKVVRPDGVEMPIAPMALQMGAARPDLESIKDEEMRSILEASFDISAKDKPLQEVIATITQDYSYINFSLDVAVRDFPIDISIIHVPLRAILSALTDMNRDLVFIIREYGIFATTRDRALSIPGPSIPEGVPYAGPNGGRLPKIEFDHSVVRGHRHEEQADKVLDYVEVNPAPKAAPTPQVAPAPEPAPEASPSQP